MFRQSDGTPIARQTALAAKGRIVDAWRNNRSRVDLLFKDADKKAEGKGEPPPKFVTTRYSRAEVPPQEPQQGDGTTEQGNEIARRGMTNHHYRSDAQADEEGLPRTLSHYSHVPTHGAMNGASNTVTVGPRDFIHRAPRGGSSVASAADESRNESAAPSEYADLKSFVPAIYVRPNVGIARNAGKSLSTHLAEGGAAVPLQAFRNASRDLDVLNSRGISFRDLYTKNLTLSVIEGNPTVRFIDCDMMPRFRPQDDRSLDAGKFVRCVYNAVAPGSRLEKADVARFVKRYVKPAYRKEVSRFLLVEPGAKITHRTHDLFDWNQVDAMKNA